MSEKSVMIIHMEGNFFIIFMHHVRAGFGRAGGSSTGVKVPVLEAVL